MEKTRLAFVGPGAKETVTTIARICWLATYCVIFKTGVGAVIRRYNKMVHRHTLLPIQSLVYRRRNSTSLNRRCGRRTASTLTLLTMPSGVHFSRKLICNASLRTLTNWNLLWRLSGTDCRRHLLTKSIDEWRQRLEAAVKNNGRHTEHLFK